MILALLLALPAPVAIHGAGATLPLPLYERWFADFAKEHPEVRVQYDAIGSGGGIQKITEKTVDFGASDVPMTDSDLRKAPGIQHIPTAIGAVVVVYNLPGSPELKVTPETLSAIFLGLISRWSDPALARDNRGLPDRAITVVHRSEDSGTTAVFTDYLAKVSTGWKSGPGAGQSVQWPVGAGQRGSEGVLHDVQQTSGAIGYVELAYADKAKLPVALIRNSAGFFNHARLDTVASAAIHADIPADFRVSLTNPPGKSAYPIATFTYLLVPRDSPDPARGAALLGFLWWALHDGQKSAAGLDYAPLPRPLQERVSAALKKLTVQGKSALDAAP